MNHKRKDNTNRARTKDKQAWKAPRDVQLGSKDKDEVKKINSEQKGK